MFKTTCCAFRPDVKTSSKKIILPILLTQQSRGGGEHRVIMEGFREEGRLELNLQKLYIWAQILKNNNKLSKTSIFPQCSAILRPVKSREKKKQKTTLKIMSSCWFTLARAFRYFNLKEMLTGHWALRSFCLCCITSLVLCQPHTLLLRSYKA